MVSIDEREVVVVSVERDGAFFKHKLTGVSGNNDTGYGEHTVILNFPLSFGKNYTIAIGELK